MSGIRVVKFWSRVLTGVCGLRLFCDKVLIAARGLGYPVPCTLVLIDGPAKRLCSLDALLGLNDHTDEVVSCVGILPLNFLTVSLFFAHLFRKRKCHNYRSTRQQSACPLNRSRSWSCSSASGKVCKTYVCLFFSRREKLFSTQKYYPLQAASHPSSNSS